MTRYLFFILIIGITAFQTGCVSNRSFFRNKIIVYNYEESGDFHDSIQNASFIDYYKDTLNIVDYPLNLFEGAVPSADSTIFPYSDIPRQFKRRKNSIYIQYGIRGISFNMKYFSVSKKDSVTASSDDALCNTNYTGWNVTTKYTGEDTVIGIPGKRVKCWVFKIEYPNVHPPIERNEIVYIEKRTLLPVQRIGTYRFPDQNDPPIMKTRVIKSRMVQVLKRPWDSASRRWRYKKCYYL